MALGCQLGWSLSPPSCGEEDPQPLSPISSEPRARHSPGRPRLRHCHGHSSTQDTCPLQISSPLPAAHHGPAGARRCRQKIVYRSCRSLSGRWLGLISPSKAGCGSASCKVAERDEFRRRKQPPPAETGPSDKAKDAPCPQAPASQPHAVIGGSFLLEVGSGCWRGQRGQAWVSLSTPPLLRVLLQPQASPTPPPWGHPPKTPGVGGPRAPRARVGLKTSSCEHRGPRTSPREMRGMLQLPPELNFYRLSHCSHLPCLRTP